MATKAHPLVRESVELHRRVVDAELRLAKERLKAFESKHGLTSEVFEGKFAAGTLGDDREWFDWAAELEVARALEQKLSALRGLP